MTIELNETIGARIAEGMRQGDFESKQEFIAAAVEFYMSHEVAELDDIRAAVAEGVLQANQGDLTPLEDFADELKAERAVSR